jgi:hypothetical protein
MGALSLLGLLFQAWGNHTMKKKAIQTEASEALPRVLVKRWNIPQQTHLVSL